jgi:phage-related minor tail protein
VPTPQPSTAPVAGAGSVTAMPGAGAHTPSPRTGRPASRRWASGAAGRRSLPEHLPRGHRHRAARPQLHHRRHRHRRAVGQDPSAPTAAPVPPVLLV